jgi:hypothetical protein
MRLLTAALNDAFSASRDDVRCAWNLPGEDEENKK